MTSAFPNPDTRPPSHGALLILDVQEGVLERALAPRSGGQIAAGCIDAARSARAAGLPVILGVTRWDADLVDAPKQPVDRGLPVPRGGYGPRWHESPIELAGLADHVFRKRQWGAFYGTDLELLLRRRNVRTLILAGLTTNFAIESTARQAWEMGFAIIFAADLLSSIDAQMHEFSVTQMLPRLGRLMTTSEIFPRSLDR